MSTIGFIKQRDIYPEFYGALGDGIADDTAAMTAWAAQGGILHLMEGRTYRAHSFQFPAASIIHTNNATIDIIGTLAPVGYTAAHVYFNDMVTIVGEMNIHVSAIWSGAAIAHVGIGARCDGWKLVSEAEFGGNGIVFIGNDSHTGCLVSRGFTRPFVVDATIGGDANAWAAGLVIEGYDIKNFTRGIKLIHQEFFTIGSGKMCQRSVQATNEAPGYNGFLCEGIRNGTFDESFIADSGEHSIRIAGPVMENITFGPVTVVRCSASAFKINGDTNVRGKSIHVAGINVIDPCYEVGVSAKASHIIRVSHTDGFTCGPVMVKETGTLTLARGAGIAICNSRDVTVASMELPPEWQPVVINDTNDANPGETLVGVQRLTIGRMKAEFPSTGGAAFVTINMQNAASPVGDIKILGIEQSAIRVPANNKFFGVTNAAGGFSGPFVARGHMYQIGNTDWMDVISAGIDIDIVTSNAADRRRAISNGGAFDPANAKKSSLFLNDLAGVPGLNALGSAIVLSRVGGGRAGAAIAALQSTADVDQVGLSLLTHSDSDSSDVLDPAVNILHNGVVDLVGNNPTIRVAGTQVLKARETGFSAITGTATKTAFATGTATLAQVAERLKALDDVLRLHGLIN